MCVTYPANFEVALTDMRANNVTLSTPQPTKQGMARQGLSIDAWGTAT